MRSVTFVQAFQYWLKFSALVIPTLIALVYFFGDNRTFNRPAPPTLTEHTTVWIKTDVRLQVTEPVQVRATGRVDDVQVKDKDLVWQPGLHSVATGAVLGFPPGTATPVVEGAPVDDATWLLPNSSGGPYSLLGTYSLLIATFLGTMGLPHVLVRFYTNPDGRDARRTAVFVLALIGIFYVAVTAVGAISRLYVPKLLISGETDAAVLLLPQAVLGSGPLGITIGALVAAGAWATFLATSSGLVVSIAGVIRTDVIGPAAPGCRGGWRRSSAGWCRCSSRRSSCGWSSPRRSRWCSRWPRRRSARCSCSASGGGTSRRPARWPGSPPAASSRARRS